MKTHFTDRSPRLKKRLVIMMAGVFAGLFAVVLAWICCLAFFEARPDVMILLIIITAVICILAIWYFIQNIYRPIKQLERAMGAVSEEDELLDFTIDIEEENELFDISSYLNKMMQRLKGYAEREYTAALLIRQAEMNALQTQINPHFLYNTLDSIRGVALKAGQDHIALMTKALSGLFRYSISNKNDLSTLQEEIKHVTNYMTIQQMRFPDKFIYITDIDTDEEADIMTCRIPKLTLQPIVENSVFHGLEKKLGSGKVVIHAFTTEKRLIISVEDDGIGMNHEQLEKVNAILQKQTDEQEHIASIALTNVNDRIKLFFGDEYGLKIRSTKNVGTVVEIQLPKVKNQL